jgi:hypothetical protein
MLTEIQITFDLPLTDKLLKANAIHSNLQTLYKYKGHSPERFDIPIKIGEFFTKKKADGHIYGVVRDEDAESFRMQIALFNLTSTI